MSEYWYCSNLYRLKWKEKLEQQHQDEYIATKRQFERDKSYLESELSSLQQKVLKMEEVKSSSSTDYQTRLREMESNLRKLELERDQLLLSQESMKQSHKDEINALENSNK